MSEPFEEAAMSGADFAKRHGNGASGGKAGERREQLRLVPPSEWDWRGAQLNLVQGILGHGMFALLYGESGTAKTLQAVDIAMHIALRRTWCGRAVQGGFVAYVAPEGGHSVHLRLHAWAKYHGVRLDDGIPLRTVPVRVDLCHGEADIEAIIANIKPLEAELGPCLLIVVDTVSRALAGGDENGPQDMGAFVRNCDRLREETKATVLAVHHQPNSGNRPRGHTSLMNASDIRLHASKLTDGIFLLSVAHLKDGASGTELIFKLERQQVGSDTTGTPVFGGLVILSDVRPETEPGRPKKTQLPARVLRALQVLQDDAAASRRWRWSFDDARELWTAGGAIDADKAPNIQRARASEIRTKLANRGLVKLDVSAIRLVIGS